MYIKSILVGNIAQPVQVSEYITGCGILPDLHKLKTFKTDFSGFILLSDENIRGSYGESVITSLRRLKGNVIDITIPGNETSKSLKEVERIIKYAVQKGANRKYCLITLGGGVTSDVGGFVASIFYRGITFIHIPTTLLSQVDAAIGGKSGVDFVSRDSLLYKNVIGTVCQPSTVISDTAVLKTLPKKEILNGLGEMVKYWIIFQKPVLSDLLEISYPIENENKLAETVALCQKSKLEFVAKDPLDKRHIREKLNLGHTIGHAIEAAGRGRFSHGQSVAVGICAAARISILMGVLGMDKYHSIIEAVKNLKLPTAVPGIKTEDVITALQVDKKSGTFVLIKDIGNVICGVKVDSGIIQKAIGEIIL